MADDFVGMYRWMKRQEKKVSFRELMDATECSLDGLAEFVIITPLRVTFGDLRMENILGTEGERMYISIDFEKIDLDKCYVYPHDGEEGVEQDNARTA